MSETYRAGHLINNILAGATHVLMDRRVEDVLDRLYWEAQSDFDAARATSMKSGTGSSIVVDDFGYPMRPQQGEFVYLIARAMNVRRAAVHAVSGGAAALYLATAVRDNGGGRVIASDPRAERIELARQNVDAAGLKDWVEFRVGDSHEGLSDLGGSVDLAVLDGWAESAATESAALRGLKALEPQLSSRAMVINENAEPDYVDYVRDPIRGYRTSLLTLGVVSLRSASA
jgi:predicted O-methyltransferase YrrM